MNRNYFSLSWMWDKANVTVRRNKLKSSCVNTAGYIIPCAMKKETRAQYFDADCNLHRRIGTQNHHVKRVLARHPVCLSLFLSRQHAVPLQYVYIRSMCIHNNQNSKQSAVDKLTCCRALCRAAICDQTARATCELLHTPSAPIAICSRTMTWNSQYNKYKHIIDTLLRAIASGFYYNYYISLL